ncbi:MAG TPA: cytochrome c family protein [Caulobacteraceae bacterium]|jgi:cytochrome c
MRRAAALALSAFALAASACSQPAGETGAPAPVSGGGAPTATPEQARALLAALPAAYQAADLDNGRQVFQRCRSCHTLTEGGSDMVGPNLWGLFGRTAGTHGAYRYSEVMKAAGFAWDVEHLDGWLTDPRAYRPGNKMSFAGLRDADDRRDVIAYLKVATSPAA